MKSTLYISAILLLGNAIVHAQFNAAEFPPGNELPPVNSPQVVEWMKAINPSQIPNFPLLKGSPPTCTGNTYAPDQCWSACQPCYKDDVRVCPKAGDWAITYDDGPSPDTPRLLQELKKRNIKATFFVMGTNVVKNAEILKQEVAEGHNIASHTWSHRPLTTLTTEQIVAEIKWTEKAVFDITGIKMKYIRPPYGDIDNRVRGIIKQLGYVVVGWTSDTYDSKDFSQTPATMAAAVTTFSTTLKTYAAAPGNEGIITLEHDHNPNVVSYGLSLLPAIDNINLKIMSVDQCLGDKQPYQNSPANNGTNGGNGGNGGTGGKGNDTTKPEIIRSAAGPSMGRSKILEIAVGVLAFGAALASF
ncbi:chitin deacetylase [Lunasporangiospora selenospora]|uniref:Chitin deacetylase n=1 Tax=Lunasporangiospora selenospora TaxID=979761 RepID=A0A9P6G1Y1_9FUNG|nr:chitin deacetylase [Lunasporangiospora selenospora]